MCNNGNGCGYIFREWLPGAEAVSVIGEFNGWDDMTHRMGRLEDVEPGCAVLHSVRLQIQGADMISAPSWVTDGSGIWSLFVSDSSTHIPLNSKYKLRIKHSHSVVPKGDVESPLSQTCDRLSAWARTIWYDAATAASDCVMTETLKPLPRCDFDFSNGDIRIYEAHIGVSADSGMGTFAHFKHNILPIIAKQGYNALLLLGIIEHVDYATGGLEPTNLFAVSSRFGTAQELQDLIQQTHLLNIAVFMQIPHFIASPRPLEGLATVDGVSGAAYFAPNGEGKHKINGRFVFDFSKSEVLRYLISSVSYFVHTFALDGIRLENLPSILYLNHGVHTQTLTQKQPFHSFVNLNFNRYAAIYLALLNLFLHHQFQKKGKKNFMSICYDNSEHPLTLLPLRLGGMGFDLCYSSRYSGEVSALLRVRDEDICWSRLFAPLAERTFVSCSTIYSLDDFDSTRVRQRPLKLAFFAWESLHTHNVGGVAPHVTELAAALSRLGHDVHVFVRAIGAMQLKETYYGVVYHQCTFALDPNFPSEMNNMCESFVTAAFEEELLSGISFDAFHAHDWLASRVLRHAKSVGRPAIFTMHSTEYGRCGNQNYGGTSKAIRDIECEMCTVADRVVCVSGALKQEVQNIYNIHEAKMRSIYNGIHCEQFDGFVDSGEIKQVYGIGAMDPTFLFVGRLVVQKGPDLLMAAIPQILQVRNDAKFIIVGEGHMRENLENSIRSLGIGHAVRMLGKKGGTELKNLFKACDAVVVPSRNEPFGIVVLEGWSAGKAVVATTNGGPRDFVTPNVTGYLVDPCAHSIAWGCGEILRNFDHARWMGTRGRVEAAYNFSWLNIAKQTVNIYYEQMNAHDAAPAVAGGKIGDCTIAKCIASNQDEMHMGVFEEHQGADRLCQLWKLIRLMFVCVNRVGLLNCMGDEFARTQHIDFPRAGNNFDMTFARTQFELRRNPALKFKHLAAFDAAIQICCRELAIFKDSQEFVVRCNDDKLIYVVEKNQCIIAFNFHPTQHFDEFVGTHTDTPRTVALHSREQRFYGNFDNEPQTSLQKGSTADNLPHSFKINLTPRSALLAAPHATTLQLLPLLQHLSNVDLFVSS